MEIGAGPTASLRVASVMHCLSHRPAVIARRSRSNLPVDECAPGWLHCVRNDGRACNSGLARGDIALLTPVSGLQDRNRAWQTASKSPKQGPWLVVSACLGRLLADPQVLGFVTTIASPSRVISMTSDVEPISRGADNVMLWPGVRTASKRTGRFVSRVSVITTRNPADSTV